MKSTAALLLGVFAAINLVNCEGSSEVPPEGMPPSTSNGEIVKRVPIYLNPNITMTDAERKEMKAQMYRTPVSQKGFITCTNEYKGMD
jgi:hypothetical protein